jgi:hypothetical protein
MVHHAAFAQAAFARNGVERQPARPVARNDDEGCVERDVAGSFGAGGVVHRRLVSVTDR